MRRSLVVGNWKMHGDRSSSRQLLASLKQELACGLAASAAADVAVCPPLVYISELAHLLADSDIGYGAQNVSQYPQGAYTGEVSAAMLADIGCRYVIVGHSERRSLYADTDQVVAEKFMAAQGSQLLPILCVGESLQQREAGDTLAVIEAQLKAVIDAAGIDAFSRAVVAYEPIWAIGTGKTATPEQAQQVHAHIRSVLAGYSSTAADEMRILYGGSVKPDNAAELFAQQDIDGALVGGASLDAESFSTICKLAA